MLDKRGMVSCWIGAGHLDNIFDDGGYSVLITTFEKMELYCVQLLTE